MIGPAIAGVLIATVGVEPCFALNAASFALMIWVLAGMDTEAAAPGRRSPSASRGRSAAALRYVRATPGALDPARPDGASWGRSASTSRCVLPLLARFTFDGGALDLRGAGRRDGGRRRRRRARSTAPAARSRPGCWSAPRSASASWRCWPRARRRSRSRCVCWRRSAPPRVMLAASINSSCSSPPSPRMRGRVMALYSIVFLGSTPIGGPLSGWLSEASTRAPPW